MRIGSNPEKNNSNIEVHNYHRVIVPVYIPNFEGYFKEAFEVFQLCIESLLATVHSKTRITIYNNNCHEKVKQYIDEKYQSSILIDQVFHSKENLGKINAILAAAKGNLEPLITITDADVLFKHNWQNAVEDVFCGFPEAGMVSPVPSSKAYGNFTANNWIYGLIKGKIYFDNVTDTLALVRFDDSLGNSYRLYKPIHLKKYLVIRNKKKNCEAVMGCGHFVATMRREVFDKGTNEPAFIKIQHGVESKFIDCPNEDLGFLRLATKDNFAYHMGNSIEEWMNAEFDTLKDVERNRSMDAKFFKTNFKKNTFKIRIGKILNFLILKQPIKKILFKRFGLSSKFEY